MDEQPTWIVPSRQDDKTIVSASRIHLHPGDEVEGILDFGLMLPELETIDSFWNFQDSGRGYLKSIGIVFPERKQVRLNWEIPTDAPTPDEFMFWVGINGNFQVGPRLPAIYRGHGILIIKESEDGS